MGRRPLHIVVFGVVLFLGACGDDGAAPSTSTAAATSTTATSNSATTSTTTTTAPVTTTTEPTIELAPLVARCTDLDPVACDLLYFFADGDAESALGASCGGAGNPGGDFWDYCSWDFTANPEPRYPGDLPLFDELYEMCGSGYGDACRALCARTPGTFDPFFSPSEYKQRACGYWVRNPGDDPFYDALWSHCGDGGYPFCDYLALLASDLATGYREQTSTCGGASAQPVANCVALLGADPNPDGELDALAAACGGGDMLSCDDLRYSIPATRDLLDLMFVLYTAQSFPPGHPPAYQMWAQTCGLRRGVDFIRGGGWCRDTFTDDAVRGSSGSIVTPGRLSVFEVRVGDCFAPVEADVSFAGRTIDDFLAIPCDRFHDNEVFALPQIAAGSGAPFPGADTVAADGRDMCEAAFPGYVGASVAESRFGVGVLPPSERSWEQGDREVICWVSIPGGIEGSVAGTSE